MVIITRKKGDMIMNPTIDSNKSKKRFIIVYDFETVLQSRFDTKISFSINLTHSLKQPKFFLSYLRIDWNFRCVPI